MDKLVLMKEYLKRSLQSDTTRSNNTNSIASISDVQTESEQLDYPNTRLVQNSVSVPIRIQRSRTFNCLRKESDILLDEICDTVSIYSEIFLPEHWLYEEEYFLEKCWSTGSKLQMTKEKNKVKAWLANGTNTFPLK